MRSAKWLWVSGIIVWVFLLLGSATIAQTYTTQEAKKYIDIGKSLYYAEKYEQSIAQFNHAANIARALNDSILICNATTRKAHAYVMNDQNQEALEAYYTSLEIARNIKNLEQEIMANSGLVLVYKKTNQYDKALDVSRQMLVSIDDTSFKNTKNHVNVITTGSEVYLDTEQYDSVLHYIEKGITLSKNLDYKEGLIDLCIKKGVVFYYREQYDTALKHLFEAEEILKNNEVKNKHYPTVNCSYFIASCYYKQGKYEEAIERLLANVEVSEEKDLYKLPVLQSHLLLANCYAAQEDFENALRWNTAYMNLNDTFQKRKEKTISKIYQKEAQNLESGMANLQTQHVKSERTKKIGYVVATVLLVLLFVVVFLVLKKQRSNKVQFANLIQKIDTLEAKGVTTTIKKDTSTPLVIDDEKVAHVLKGLAKLEEQEYYLRSDCNLRSVAKKVKTNATYLSKIINLHQQKNFNEYINDLRIGYVLQRLQHDKKFRSFSIKSIATEIGYKSDYSFAKHFKAKTGLNPSYYIKNLQKQEKSLENTI
ncbi:tetratricopeptide repeat protein [Aquimarina sp. D1M17]|uniref:AraC family transcriptional regulator n=1 Tax=Aquimarina acroporae TaxID=2937283 RepID=UPI0020C119F5|nr:AraC family transcriptional regulator [Aquimarina acroporae]MCK8523089.1 tetratricopeptide repeat protein [Aquimarina acroporae]